METQLWGQNWEMNWEMTNMQTMPKYFINIDEATSQLLVEMDGPHNVSDFWFLPMCDWGPSNNLSWFKEEELETQPTLESNNEEGN